MNYYFDPEYMTPVEHASHLAQTLDGEAFPDLYEAAKALVEATAQFKAVLEQHNKDSTAYDVENLLRRLKGRTDSILKAIDEDPKLNKGEHENGLVIANASKALFTPEEEHQLYAKGIVYLRNPYRLVSLPLIKIYNYGEKEPVNILTDKLAQDETLRITLPVKEDGYMAQIFEHDGEVYTTTRSLLEGADNHLFYQNREDDQFDYVKGIRAIAEDKYPALLDPEVIRGKTIVCEAIHPDMANGVTKYPEGTEDLVVISIFDRETFEYWSNDRVIQWATKHHLEPVDYLTTDVSLREAVEVVAAIEDDEHVPEGGVVCFEKDGRILHRVKVKTARWFREHSLRYNCTLKSVVEIVWRAPEYEDFEAFADYLRDEGLTSEETLDLYQEHHETYLQWKEDCAAKAEEVQDILREALEATKGSENEAKALAAYVRERYPKDDFGLIMNCYRRPERVLYDAMWQNELYSGIKELIHDARMQR